MKSMIVAALLAASAAAAHAESPFAYSRTVNGTVLLYSSPCSAQGGGNWQRSVLEQPYAPREGCWRRYYEKMLHDETVQFCAVDPADGGARKLSAGGGCFIMNPDRVYSAKTPPERAF